MEGNKKNRVGRPRTIKRKYEKSSQEGLQENWTRATFIVREDLLDKLKYLAWYERRSIKEEVEKMMLDYLADKEIPEERGKDDNE